MRSFRNFSEIVLVSRTLEKCEAIAADVLAKRRWRFGRRNWMQRCGGKLLSEKRASRAFDHVALPYQDLPLMDACLAAGVDYLDTANYEPPNEAKFEYKCSGLTASVFVRPV